MPGTPQRLAWRRDYARRKPETILRHRLAAAINLLERERLLPPSEADAARHTLAERRWAP